MERETDLSPDDLDRPDWNDLLSNYSKHDIGEAYLKGRIDRTGLVTEPWGIDQRHEDEDLIFDNKMDLRIWKCHGGTEKPVDWPGLTAEAFERDAVQGTVAPVVREQPVEWSLRGICDVKTKANKDWMCALNLRHLAHYSHWADEFDVPVFLFFTMVDAEAESVGDESAIVPVTTDWPYEAAVDHFDRDTNHSEDWYDLKQLAAASDMVDRVSRAPDGNPVAWIDDDWKEGFMWFENEVV